MDDYDLPASWLAACIALTRPSLSSLPPYHLLDLGCALASVGCSPDSTWTQEYLEALQPHLKDLDTTSLAAIAQILGAFSFKPSREWVDALLAAASDQLLKAMVPAQLVQIISALAKLQVEVGDQWMAQWTCAAHLRARSFKTEEVEEVLVGVAALHVVFDEGGEVGGDQAFRQQLLQKFTGCLMSALGETVLRVGKKARKACVLACLHSIRSAGCSELWVSDMVAQLHGSCSA